MSESSETNLSTSLTVARREIDACIEASYEAQSDENWDGSRQILLRAHGIAAENFGECSPITIELELLKAVQLIREREYGKALTNCLEIREKIRKGLYEGHPLELSLNRRLGEVFQAQGQSEEALNYYVETITRFEELQMFNDPAYAEVLALAGDTARSRESFDLAKSFYDKCIRVYESENFSDLDAINTRMSYLGSEEMRDQYHDDQSRRFLEEALAIFEASFHPNDVFKTDIWLEIGEICFEFGEFEEAHRFWMDAYQERIAAFGNEDPRLLRPLELLIEMYLEHGTYEQIKTLYDHYLSIMKQEFGPLSDEYLNALIQAVGAYLRVEAFEEAGAFISQEAEEVKGAAEGDEPDPDAFGFYAALNHLQGVVALQADKPEQAEEFMLHARSKRVEVYGEKSRVVAESDLGLAALYETTGDEEKAAEFAKRVWDEGGSHLEPNDPYVRVAEELLMRIGVLEEQEEAAPPPMEEIEAEAAPEQPKPAKTVQVRRRAKLFQPGMKLDLPPSEKPKPEETQESAVEESPTQAVLENPDFIAGKQLLTAGELESAEERFTDLLNTLERTYGPRNKRLVPVLHALSDVKERSGDKEGKASCLKRIGIITEAESA